MDYQTILTILAVVVVAIAGAIYIPKLKKAKVITPGNIEGAKDALVVAEFIFNKINKNDAFKDRTKVKFIFELANDIGDYVSNLPDTDPDKFNFTIDVMNHVFEKLKVNVTEDEKKIIALAVRDALSFLQK